jgi:hypothetical protein
MDETWIAALIGSCTIVTAFAMIGFNQPSWSRTYTSLARFRFASLAHVGLYLLLLAIFYALLRRGFSAVRVDTLWLALVLTLVVRSIGPLSRRIRRWTHGLAGIPESAQRLALELAGADLKASDSIRHEARDVLMKRGVDVTCEWVPIVQPVQNLVFKATTLFIQLRGWEDDPKYARFAAETRHEIDHLRRRFDQMSFRVSRVLATIERLGELRHLYSEAEHPAERTERFDELLRDAVGDLITDSCEEIDAFHEDACLLAARGALATRWWKRGRDALLASLGFQRRPQEPQRVYAILGWTAGLLLCGMWIYFTLLPSDDSDLTFKERILIVTLIVFGAFAIAIVPKLRWGFANGGLHGRTPVAFVVGAGVAAMLFAVIVNSIAGAILIGGLNGVLTRLQIGSAFLPAAFFTASTMAMLVQDHQWRSIASSQMRRLRDGVTLGAVWLATSGLALVLRAEIHDISYPEPSHALVVTAVAFVFGGILGYSIPEAVRMKRPERRIAHAPVAVIAERYSEPATATPATAG